MLKTHRALLAAVVAATLAAFAAGTVLAQSKGGGKIVCWKDKAGKVVGCGDTVPPEYQDSATRELDRSGVTRKTTDPVAEAKRAAEEELMKVQKAEEKKRLTEQRRQEAALMATFSNEKEIDLKRDRDLEVVDRQIAQMHVSQKNASERAAELKGRIDAAEKAKKPASDFLKDEAARAEAEQIKYERGIAAKEKEKQDIRVRYAEMKKRYSEISGGGRSAAAPAAPAKK